MDEKQKQLVKKWSPLAAIGLLVLVTFGGTVGAYNDLVTQEEAVTGQSKQIDVAYQRAFRLVPALVDMAEQYMQNETEVIERATALRSGLVAADGGGLQGKDDYMQGVVEFVALVGNRVEAYPELKSAALYRDTMTEMVNSENKIAAEKVRYNDRVQAFNGHIRKCCFPSLAAGLFGFDAAEYLGFEGRPNTSQWDGGDY